MLRIPYNSLRPTQTSIQQRTCNATALHVLATWQVNNAGVALPNWSQEHWSGNVATNAAGPVLLTQALLPAMSDGGTVVMVSSGGAPPLSDC